MAIGDQVGKQAVDELVGQLPQIETFIDGQLTKIRETVQQIVADAKTEIETVVGGALAAVTAERTQAITQFSDEVNGILDRLSGLSVQIPERKAK
jgi:hypothetical protein